MGRRRSKSKKQTPISQRVRETAEIAAKASILVEEMVRTFAGRRDRMIELLQKIEERL